jgi:crossover junction endodeoxyribonuclease RusA
VPQGSKSAFAFVGRDGRPRATVTDVSHRSSNGSSLAEWRASIATEARRWCEDHGAPAPLDCPVGAVITFYLARPSSTPKRVIYPARKPDLDKLARGVLDAITGVLIVDDARIVELVARKRFAAGVPPHAYIVLQAL